MAVVVLSTFEEILDSTLESIRRSCLDPGEVPGNLSVVLVYNGTRAKSVLWSKKPSGSRLPEAISMAHIAGVWTLAMVIRLYSRPVEPPKPNKRLLGHTVYLK